MGHTPETRKRALEKVLQRRVDWLDANGPCVLCGSSDDLEVDHLDPTVKDSHRIWSWSLERRTAELKKCQVLCSKCHKQKTREQRRESMKHGTESMYRFGPCRCELCLVGRNEYKRQQRARRRAKGLIAK